ncbi:hypothetical protein FDJ20_gp117 [Vibrio phage Thalassa]|uniref:Uncharacterized protein n=1 Tax=Vibrio phage Thalassa TaxID=2570301 RepID=A0A2H5BHB3_9CAUD|nr:hypothetical protein FDJ20_gp117 [Vibrio phage Thalassa]AUG85385.1 hypothetical protein THALASSA_206 [Vibrio phage Thalassa]
MRKVIFLDFDGVINAQTGEWKTTEVPDYLGYCPHNPKLVQTLNILIERSQADLVISSTWRLGTDITTLQQVCTAIGIKGKVIGKTDSLGKWTVRGNEIDKYIDEHKEQLGYDYSWNYKSYVILDDDSDMLLPQAANFVRIDNEVGITLKDVEKAMQVLS